MNKKNNHEKEIEDNMLIAQRDVQFNQAATYGPPPVLSSLSKKDDPVVIIKNTLAKESTLVESPELTPVMPAVSAETPIPDLVHTGDNTGKIQNSTPVTIMGKQIVTTQYCQHCNKDTVQKCIEVDTEDEAGILVWQCKTCNQLTEFE